MLVFGTGDRVEVTPGRSHIPVPLSARQVWWEMMFDEFGARGGDEKGVGSPSTTSPGAGCAEQVSLLLAWPWVWSGQVCAHGQVTLGKGSSTGSLKGIVVVPVVPRGVPAAGTVLVCRSIPGRQGEGTLKT